MPKTSRRHHGTGSLQSVRLASGSIRFFLLFYSSGKRQKSPRFASEKEVWDWFAAHGSTNGTPASSARLLFSSAASSWLESRSARPAKMAAYRSTLNLHVLPVFDDKPMADISTDNLHAYINSKLEGEKKLSPATLRMHLAMIRSIFSYAIAEGTYDGRNPANSSSEKIKNIGKDQSKAKALGRKELQNLFRAAAESEHAFLACLSLLGLRYGEAAALRWQDWNHSYIHVKQALKQEGTIETTGKTPNSDRSLPCSAQVDEYLRAHHQRRKLAGLDVLPHSLMFAKPDGRPRDHRSYSRYVLKPIAQAANLGHITPHMLRHTFAQNQINAGTDIARISRMMGHATPGFTLDRYTHFMDKDLSPVVILDL